jgi:hypothetical protein
MADRFEIPLDIEGVKIERVDFTLQGEILIMVTSFIPSFLYHAEHFCEGTMFEEHFAEALHEGT